jgi:hypothetical protein
VSGVRDQSSNGSDEALLIPFTNSKAIHVVAIGGKIQTTWFVTDFGMRRGGLTRKESV